MLRLNFRVGPVQASAGAKEAADAGKGVVAILGFAALVAVVAFLWKVLTVLFWIALPVVGFFGVLFVHLAVSDWNDRRKAGGRK